MISNNVTTKLKNIDNNYVVSGSQAVMLYIGYDIRKCSDLDLHLSKEIPCEKISKQLGIAVDISYEPIPYQIYKGIRIIQLERLLANKLNRLNEKIGDKDLYDLYFLFDLKYSTNILKKYLVFKNTDLVLDENGNVDFSKFYFEVGLEECIQKIKNNLHKIYS